MSNIHNQHMMENLYEKFLEELLDKGVPPMIAERAAERMVNKRMEEEE